MKNFKYLLATFTVAASLCACSTGEYVVDLKTPITVENINQGTKAVCVANVTDNRLFIGNEAKPNLPSGAILSKDYKARSYARLKTLGEQSGALLLPQNKTVASLFKDLLEQALRESGYQVVSEVAAENSNDVAIMAVDIKKFWTYAGLDKLNADIVNEVEIDVYAQNNGTQKKLTLKNKQTKKVLTDTKGQYKTTTEASIANIYHLALEKLPLILGK